MSDTINSSDVSFGDIVVNSCDSAWDDLASARDSKTVNRRVYGLAVYSLFANRVVVPSRYLLYGGCTFEAVKVLEGLLEAGVIIPDLQEKNCSFSQYVSSNEICSSDVLERAKYLDDHAETVYVFTAKEQSKRYKEHLLSDVDPDEKGLLYRLIKGEYRDVEEDAFLRIRDAFWRLEGSRRAFVECASNYAPMHRSTFEKWAAMRYYLTPAECERRFIRDLPSFASGMLRAVGASRPEVLAAGDGGESGSDLFRYAYGVLLALPASIESERLKSLSDVVLEVRRQVPRGSSKFAELSEQGFSDSVSEIDSVLNDALQSERDIARLMRSKPLSFARNLLVSQVSFVLGMVSGSAMGIVADPAIDAAVDGVGCLLRKNKVPFIETTERFKMKVDDLVWHTGLYMWEWT